MKQALCCVGVYWRLMRFDRPVGTLLLLWPTLWALWLASGGIPPHSVLLVFVSGVVLMRAAGCIMNDVLDRCFDGHVARTRLRPLVTGEASLGIALVLCAFLCLSSFALVLTLNALTIVLSLPALLTAMLYPLAKRFIALPQVVLGIAFAWSIPMAFAAVTNRIPLIAWLLFAATFFWIIAYDTAYAMADRKDDLVIGIKSSAIFFGRFDRFWVAIFQGIFLLLLLLMGLIAGLHLLFFLLLPVVLCFFIYQQWLLAEAQPLHYLRAFSNNNWVGALIFFAVVCSLV